MHQPVRTRAWPGAATGLRGGPYVVHTYTGSVPLRHGGASITLARSPRASWSVDARTRCGTQLIVSTDPGNGVWSCVRTAVRGTSPWRPRSSCSQFQYAFSRIVGQIRSRARRHDRLLLYVWYIGT